MIGTWHLPPVIAKLSHGRTFSLAEETISSLSQLNAVYPNVDKMVIASNPKAPKT
jgi:hypothetical protein